MLAAGEAMSTAKPEIWAESHLNAIRGLAALAVVLGHVRTLLFPAFTAAAASSGGEGGPRLTLGHEAVMVFFVLSGFLVGGSVLRSFQRGSWSWRGYLIKRLVRLWIVLVPAIALGLALDCAGVWLFGGSGSLYSAPPGQDYVSLAALRSEREGPVIMGNLLFLQRIFVPTLGTNVPLWSLANEFWYYLAFPLLLVAAHPAFRLTGRLAAAAGAVAILALIGRTADVLMLPWLMGAAVSQVPAVIPPRLRVPAAWATAVIMMAVLDGAKRYIANIDAAELMVGLAAALLVYTVKCQDRAGDTGLYGRVSGFIARLSYTLYLTHLPFLIFVFTAVSGPWALHPVSAGGLAKMLGLVAAALVWAWALYRLFERRTDAAREAVLRFLGKTLSPSTPPE